MEFDTCVYIECLQFELFALASFMIDVPNIRLPTGMLQYVVVFQNKTISDGHTSIAKLPAERCKLSSRRQDGHLKRVSNNEFVTRLG